MMSPQLTALPHYFIEY